MIAVTTDASQVLPTQPTLESENVGRAPPRRASQKQCIQKVFVKQCILKDVYIVKQSIKGSVY